MIPSQPRAMSIGDLFDAAFRLYHAHFVAFVGIAAVLLVPMTIVQSLSVLSLGSGPVVPLINSSTIVELFQRLIVLELVSGVLANGVSRSYLSQPISIVEAYRLGVRRYGTLLLALLARGLIVSSPFALIIGRIFSAGRDTGSAWVFAMLLLLLLPLWIVKAYRRGVRRYGTLLLVLLASCMFGAIFGVGRDTGSLWIFGMPLLLPLAMFFFVRFILVTQVIVLEDCGLIDSLKRSWSLVKGSSWRVFWISVLISILTYFISDVPAMLLGFLLSLGTPFNLSPSPNLFLIIRVASQIGLILALPLQLSIYTLLYYDLRVRREGYDLELQMQQAASP